ncbi:hypothetical protein LCT82_000555 [Salmonella enterica]|nr:hypothetical protein [Salmonella enterica]
MSTRSTISVLCRDGLVRTVYCHQDSNLQHNGRILAEYYNSWNAVIGYHYVYDASCWFIRTLTVRGWKYRLLRDALRGCKR